MPGRYRSNDTSCRDHVMKEFGLLHKLSHPNLQPLHTLCVCSKKGEVLAGGAIHHEVRGRPPVLKVSEETATPSLEEQQIARVELFHERGSLKDYIHNVSSRLFSIYCVEFSVDISHS